MKGRITKRSVDALQWQDTGKAGKLQFLWDDQLIGFGVAVAKSGRRTFLYDYRLNGKRERLKIGVYGPITADEARTIAKSKAVAVAGGSNPAQIRRDTRLAPSFSELADLWIEHVQATRKARTAKEYKRAIDVYLRPDFGKLPLAAIGDQEIRRLVHAMRDTKYQANRVRAIFSSFWAWAAKAGYCKASANPTTGIVRYKEEGRERYLTSDEISRLGDALKDYERRSGPYASAAIRLLFLTGARVSEILNCRWDYIDAERGLIFLPDSKTGKKTIVLTGAAMAVIDSIPKVDGNPFLIPGLEDRARADLKAAWSTIREATGLPDVRLHDLRHSFASVGAGDGFGLPIVGKLLGHSNSRTTERYAHLADSPVRAAAERISSKIGAALAGEGGAK